MTYNISSIEDTVREKYHKQINNLLSLAESNKIPAICLTGEDKSLIEIIIRIFLTTYENKSFKEIYNCNDFYEIKSDSGSIKIDDIRKLLRFSTLKKEHLKHKYTVIKNIETANIYAQNSLLKIIEEPGIDTLFLCSSCSFHSLLNTIRSRLFRINIPSKALNEMEGNFCDEVKWLARVSIDVLIDFSQLSKFQQKQLIYSIRKKDLSEIIEDYLRSCGDYEIEFEGGITIRGRSLSRLYALLLVEKLFLDFFYSPDEINGLIFDFKTLITKKSIYKTSKEKSSITSFNNVFFKELFSITEEVIYIMLNFQEGFLLGSLSYTYLTELCLKQKPKLKKEAIKDYLEFIEQIKNSNQISLNTELLMINFILKTRKIFNESERTKWE